MVLHCPGEKLQFEDVPDPEPTENQILITVEACGVCRTDLHIVDGDLTQPKLPLIPGHEIVGRIVRSGSDVAGFTAGARVGVPWLGWTCGICNFCRMNCENLCDSARFTGYTLDGGYAELCAADANYCFPMDEGAAPESLAPLLCAGLIGYRALRLAGNARRIGIYGFGAAAHLIAQLAIFEGRDVYAFTRPGDSDAQTYGARTWLQMGIWF
jgi:propanol-preferring alcohol dehydrogenase